MEALPVDPLTFSPHHYWLRDQGPAEADPELMHAEAAAPRSAPRRKSAAPARAAPVEEEEAAAPVDPLTFSPHHYWLRDQGPAEADPELEAAAASPRSAPRRKSAAPASRTAAAEEIEEAEEAPPAPPANPLTSVRSPHHIWLRDQGPVEADPEIAAGGARGGGAASSPLASPAPARQRAARAAPAARATPARAAAPPPAEEDHLHFGPHRLWLRRNGAAEVDPELREIEALVTHAHPVARRGPAA